MKMPIAVLIVATVLPCQGMAKNQLDKFELHCATGDGTTLPHTFDVDVSDEGLTTVSEPSVSALVYDAEVYVNAIVWEAGGIRYVAERFEGELTTFPDSAKWKCTKVGGKKFWSAANCCYRPQD